MKEARIKGESISLVVALLGALACNLTRTFLFEALTRGANASLYKLFQFKFI